MKRVSFPLFVCASVAISVGMIACGHQSDQKGKVRLNGKAAPQFVYDLKGVKSSDDKAACTTGKQAFTDLAQFCEALQSKTVNNDCALEERKAKFKEKCSGEFQEHEREVETTPDTSGTATTDDVAELVEKKEMTAGSSANSPVVIVSEAADHALQVERIQIACAESFEKAALSKDTLNLIVGSEGVVVRSHKDSEQKQKALHVVCKGEPGPEAFLKPQLNEGVAEATIAAGSSSVLKVSTQKLKLNIYCDTNGVNALTKEDGLILTVGSKVVLWDDSAEKPVQIIRCNKATGGPM